MIFNDVILFESMAKNKNKPSYTHAWNKYLMWINSQIPLTKNYLFTAIFNGTDFSFFPSPQGDIFKIVDLCLSEPKILWKWTIQPYVIY